MPRSARCHARFAALAQAAPLPDDGTTLDIDPPP